MKNWINRITDRVATRKGAWITLGVWILLAMLLSAGPSMSDYKVTNFESLPEDAASLIADEKLATYFPNDQGIPGILVFEQEDGVIDRDAIDSVTEALIDADISGIERVVDVRQLPPPARAGFSSENGNVFLLPVELDSSLGSDVLNEIVTDINNVVDTELASYEDVNFYVTGPAGIAGDTLKLFEQADFVLILATIGIILILLIAIYRSPLLALIPLLATALVYQVSTQALGLAGAAGLEINNSTSSIVSILLFAAVIDYSLFVFSRYREELGRIENKYEAMRVAMRSTGEPVFIAGGTVLAAMLVLFVATFRDYQNFAPVFGLTMFIIMFASITLVPALFALFGRKAFWPRVPRVGQNQQEHPKFWSRVATFVTKRPLITGGAVALLLVISSLNVFNIKFEYDIVKSFPEDLPSRQGYEIVETNFDKGDLAPTTILLESDEPLDENAITRLQQSFEATPGIASTRFDAANDTKTAVQYTMTLDLNPYSREAIDLIESIREESDERLSEQDIDGTLHFAGTTAQLVDEKQANARDIYLIVALETILILGLLYALTRSRKMPFYMMGTILLSYTAALGLGIFLVDLFFGIDAISTRVPVYAFIFLVALGIDYNIILVSRFLEERVNRPVKEALQVALTHTGGVISSAGLILAATFAALMTMPIADLFVFGFIVAIGILLDTFLVRGVLLPALMLWFEKE